MGDWTVCERELRAVASPRCCRVCLHSGRRGSGVGGVGTTPPTSIPMSVFNYDATGGLDIDKLNAAMGAATSATTTMCKRAIESSLRLRVRVSRWHSHRFARLVAFVYGVCACVRLCACCHSFEIF